MPQGSLLYSRTIKAFRNLTLRIIPKLPSFATWSIKPLLQNLIWERCSSQWAQQGLGKRAKTPTQSLNPRPVFRVGFVSQKGGRWCQEMGYWLSRGSVSFCQQQGMGEVWAGHAPPACPGCSVQVPGRLPWTFQLLFLLGVGKLCAGVYWGDTWQCQFPDGYGHAHNIVIKIIDLRMLFFAFWLATSLVVVFSNLTFSSFLLEIQITNNTFCLFSLNEKRILTVPGP